MTIHTYDNIISIDNLLTAWREFIRGKRKQADVQEFERDLMANIIALHNDLKNQTYDHSKYQAFNISDPKPRNIHKAAVRDRLLHHAIYHQFYPYFDKRFIPYSYSCRKGKGIHKALDAFTLFARKVSKNHTCTVWVLKCDIRKFFASIDHQVLLSVLKQSIADQDIQRLLQKIIYSFTVAPNKGLPLGNPTSQLFVNVYMNEFDQYVKHQLKAKYYIRYADDFVFLSHDRSYLVNILSFIEQFLSDNLKLSLHPHKVGIETVASGVDFLGWTHFPNHRVLRTTTKKRMYRGLYRAEGKNETLQSYLGLLQHGDAYDLQQKAVNLAHALQQNKPDQHST